MENEKQRMIASVEMNWLRLGRSVEMLMVDIKPSSHKNTVLNQFVGSYEMLMVEIKRDLCDEEMKQETKQEMEAK